MEVEISGGIVWGVNFVFGIGEWLVGGFGLVVFGLRGSGIGLGLGLIWDGV